MKNMKASAAPYSLSAFSPRDASHGAKTSEKKKASIRAQRTALASGTAA